VSKDNFSAAANHPKKVHRRTRDKRGKRLKEETYHARPDGGRELTPSAPFLFLYSVLCLGVVRGTSTAADAIAFVAAADHNTTAPAALNDRSVNMVGHEKERRVIVRVD
jgi:hypothetical protein